MYAMESTPAITNNEIRLIRSLATKKGRDESGLFIVEGEKMVAEANLSAMTVERIYERSRIGDAKMERISAMSGSSPVLAVLRQPKETVLNTVNQAAEVLGSSGLFLFLDSIRDPGNLGTILRISDWFGINAVFASEDTVDIFNPKVVQATMGAIFRVKFHYCSFDLLREAASESAASISGTFLDGDCIYSADLPLGDKAPSIIVIGNESNGISPEVEKSVDRRLLIPPFPADVRTSESLNAAVATAVTVAEFRRRLL